jgi:hypothetical protein
MNPIRSRPQIGSIIKNAMYLKEVVYGSGGVITGIEMKVNNIKKSYSGCFLFFSDSFDEIFKPAD